MKPETIKAIFTNLLFVIGVILLIVGFVQGTRTVVKLAVFPKYPLDSYLESRCENNFAPIPATGVDTKYQEPTTVDAKEVKIQCEKSLEEERKVRVTEDIVGSTTLLISGLALIYFFRKFIK